MALPDLSEKIKTFSLALVDFIRDFIGRIIEKIIDKIPEEKRRLVLLCSGGGALLVLLLIAGVSLLKGGNSAKYRFAPADGPVLQTVIPPEELFLPEEPDFLPGVLLERERRSVWTAEDAGQFWQDPLKNGEERWRGRIEALVDNILEQAQ